MRGLVPGLATPSPFLQRLPGVYQDERDDEFFPRFIRAFDDVVAPTISTLDNLVAYVDPQLAPEDFVDWLAAWVDVAPDGAWTLEQRRAIVSQAVAVHRRAGTLDGIRDAVQLAAGPDARVSVGDNGAVAWSQTPGAALPGTSPPRVTVSVTGAGDEDVRRRIARVLRAVVPAHVPWTIEPHAGGDTT